MQLLGATKFMLLVNDFVILGVHERAPNTHIEFYGHKIYIYA